VGVRGTRARAELHPESTDLRSERSDLISVTIARLPIAIDPSEHSPREPRGQEGEESPGHDTRVKVGVPIETVTAGRFFDRR
jgi:hypothetical protein